MYFSFSRNSYDIKKWNESFSATYSSLNNPLPDNLHLLTMETLKTNTVILRFENFYEMSERDEEAWVNLDGLFKEFTIKTLTPMNLAANQELKDKRMWQWQTNEQRHTNPNNQASTPNRGLLISLKPMEIRTFIAEVEFTVVQPEITVKNVIISN